MGRVSQVWITESTFKGCQFAVDGKIGKVSQVWIKESAFKGLQIVLPFWVEIKVYTVW